MVGAGCSIVGEEPKGAPTGASILTGGAMAEPSIEVTLAGTSDVTVAEDTSEEVSGKADVLGTASVPAVGKVSDTAADGPLFTGGVATTSFFPPTNFEINSGTNLITQILEHNQKHL